MRGLHALVWNPLQSLHGLYGILQRAYTPCVGSYTEPTRHVGSYTEPTRCVGSYSEPTRSGSDPIQSLHGLYGVPYKAYTACTGSYAGAYTLCVGPYDEPARP
eukprot:2424200-Pyramimonas_sp.AAC.1